VDLGDVFLLAEFIGQDHIHFIGYKDESRLVVFNFTSDKPSVLDRCCLITRAEYPPLKGNSLVAYRFGQLLEDSSLIRALETSGIRQRLDPLSADVIQKIQNGALASKFTPEKIKRVFRRVTSSARPAR